MVYKIRQSLMNSPQLKNFSVLTGVAIVLGTGGVSLAQTDPEEELDPEDLFQEASRQQSAIVQYRDVRAPSEYSQGTALNAERIPWQYRGLVKKYFLAIRPPPHRAPQYDFLQDRFDEEK